MSSVDPNMVRALVRQALEKKLGLSPTPRVLNHPHPASDSFDSGAASIDARVLPEGEGVNLSVHPSHLAIGEGPALSAYSEWHEDMDLPLQKPCLIEPHRPCYNSGYCKKLGH